MFRISVYVLPCCLLSLLCVAQVRLWDIESGDCQVTLKGHKVRVHILSVTRLLLENCLRLHQA